MKLRGWQQMNRTERIAWIVGAVSGAVCILSGYLVYVRMLLFLYPLFGSTIVMVQLALVVIAWRRKRLEAIVHLLGAIALVIVQICVFVF